MSTRAWAAGISELGDRFLLCRMEPNEKQFLHAIKHANRATQMRARLVEAVTDLFAAPLLPPRDIGDREIRWLNDILQIVARLRGAVKLAHRTASWKRSTAPKAPPGSEKARKRVLAGLDCLGVKRSKARKLIRAIALRQRRAQPAECLSLSEGVEKAGWSTPRPSPRSSSRRRLPRAARWRNWWFTGPAERDPQGRGNPDLWRAV